MGGKSSRTKGHSYEREIAKKLREIYPNARRALEYQEGTGVDIENTGKLRIQCKRGKRYAPVTKIKEVQLEGIPVLITKADREKDIACLYLEDFLEMLEVFNAKDR